ncbi:hypothetical protein F511_25427 [Dorcoceras hygrometricum]|uniref:Uncharacterized protein n=1 Tax=Dorcoceras hygrometricum TaxID=472368 RepID=A0A2Z7CQB9_9LAMI|nr:hypothetical protein F511_25427 [Dorcoceras hygrometricum]
MHEGCQRICHLGQRVSWQIKGEPLYHAQPISRWKSSVRDIQDDIFVCRSKRGSQSGFNRSTQSAGGNHRSVIFRNDIFVCRSKRGSQSGFNRSTGSICMHVCQEIHI